MVQLTPGPVPAAANAGRLVSFCQQSRALAKLNETVLATTKLKFDGVTKAQYHHHWMIFVLPVSDYPTNNQLMGVSSKIV